MKLNRKYLRGLILEEIKKLNEGFVDSFPNPQLPPEARPNFSGRNLYYVAFQ